MKQKNNFIKIILTRKENRLTAIVNNDKIFFGKTSYIFGNMARKFLPSNRKSLDYEGLIICKNEYFLVSGYPLPIMTNRGAERNSTEKSFA